MAFTPCFILHFESFCLFNVFFFQNSCYSKLEKADILEMTVQHLKNLKSQQVAGKQFYSLSFNLSTAVSSGSSMLGNLNSANESCKVSVSHCTQKNL